MMTNTRVRARLVFVALLALAACTSEREETVAQPAAPGPVDAPGANPPPAPLPPPKAATPPAVPTLGKLAPEIIGEDIDGKPIKLSDYRGKVVMLDFWGNW
jgi:hypothetical protein